jgi:hypothetical protein
METVWLLRCFFARDISLAIGVLVVHLLSFLQGILMAVMYSAVLLRKWCSVEQKWHNIYHGVAETGNSEFALGHDPEPVTPTSRHFNLSSTVILISLQCPSSKLACSC